MTRIVAGVAGGRTLAVPERGTRPTSERVREALFSRLESYGVLRGARVLDLFAGSGALGLEAASRGASEVTLVERARPAAEVARRNIRTLGLPGTHLVVDRAERFVATPPAEPWDLVLIDPPYDIVETTIVTILDALAAQGTLSVGAVVVIERSRRSPESTWPAGWELLASKRYGDTTLWFVGPELPDEPT